jgi:hypothetical protein
MRAKDILNEDWQKVNKSDKTDGMSNKAVKAYRRENPGSKLKTAVTTKPSKLKKGSKSAKRRKSFCSRMSGMKKAHASAKTKRDPDSPINKALRRWNCESIEQSIQEIEQQLEEAKKKTLKNSNPCWKGYHPVGTKKKGGRTVPNCVPKESMDEAANAAQQAAIAISMKKAGKKPKQKVSEFAPVDNGGMKPPRGPKTPGKDPWGDNDPGDDPYSRPNPEYYNRSIDFFGKFEADHFDKEDFNEKTGVFKGYWDYDGELKQIAYFKFDDPQQAARDFNDSPGMGWYYEPENEGLMEAKSQKQQQSPKPRNFVAKNATTSGAGAHKDKKKAEKQGDVKHKGKMLDMAEDAEPMDREFALVKKLGRLGERIVQNPKLWDKYSEVVEGDDPDWIISLIQDGTGATSNEVLRLSDLFGEIGGGLGRIIDFAWAVKEGTWEKDFLNPYRQHRSKRDMAEAQEDGTSYQGNVKNKGKMLDLAEMDSILEKASRQLCKSSKPDDDLGASNLASCKSQGLRARDGEKSHLIGHGNSSVRIKVGGKRIKGKKYGGPLPDYGTRKGQ